MIKIKSFGSGSSGNAYLIDDGHSKLLIECGVNFKKVMQEMSYDLYGVVGCLISHEHRDHCSQVNQLLLKTSIDVYSTVGTINAMKNDAQLKISKFDNYRFNQIVYKETTKIGTWYVTPFETKHDAVEPAGFLIDNTSGDRLVFITDSYYVKYQFPNATHMMVEANYSKDVIDEKMTAGFDLKRKTRLLESHFDFENTLEFIKKNKSNRLQEIWLLHLSDSNSNEKQFKSDVQKMTGVPVYIA